MCGGGGKARRARREARRAAQRAAAERQRMQDEYNRTLRQAYPSWDRSRPAMRPAPAPVAKAPEPVMAPEPLVGPQGQTSGRVRQRRSSKRTAANYRRRGTGSLRIAVNVPSSSRGGGLNLG